VPYPVTIKNGKTVLIRLIEREDVDGIWDNFNQVIEERKFLPSFTPVISEWERDRWYNHLQDNDNICVVAIDGKQKKGKHVVGQCTIENSEWEAAEHVGVLGIIVRSDFRNQGLGQKIIEAALKEAVNNGKEKVILSTFATNYSGLNLYKKCGFKEVGCYTKQYKLDNIYYDEILMETWLDNKN
jgi:RimJ/RimL family protein N-acetyltransferase